MVSLSRLASRNFAVASLLFLLFGFGLFGSTTLIPQILCKASGTDFSSFLTNLFRKLGGSFGIAFITTATERRRQFHQTNLGSAVGATSQAFRQQGQPVVVSSLLLFMDCFRVIARLTFGALALLLLVQRFKPPGQASAAH